MQTYYLNVTDKNREIVKVTGYRTECYTFSPIGR